MRDPRPRARYAPAPTVPPVPDDLRALAAAVLLQAIRDGDRAFFGARSGPWAASRQVWLEAAGLDETGLLAALRRRGVCAIGHRVRRAERRARQRVRAAERVGTD